MKLKKNVNMKTLIARFQELQNEAAVLISLFTQASSLLDDGKLGITELNMKMDEEVMRFHSTYGKIEELMKNL